MQDSDNNSMQPNQLSETYWPDKTLKYSYRILHTDLVSCK